MTSLQYFNFCKSRWCVFAVSGSKLWTPRSSIIMTSLNVQVVRLWCLSMCEMANACDDRMTFEWS